MVGRGILGRGGGSHDVRCGEGRDRSAVNGRAPHGTRLAKSWQGRPDLSSDEKKGSATDEMRFFRPPFIARIDNIESRWSLPTIVWLSSRSPSPLGQPPHVTQRLIDSHQESLATVAAHNRRWCRWLIVSLWLLIAATAPLWNFPLEWWMGLSGDSSVSADTFGSVPRVPLVPIDSRTAGWVGTIGIGLAALSSVFSLWRPDDRRGWCGLAVGLIACFAADQLTLQPWAYLNLLHVGLRILRPPAAIGFHGLLTALVYFYSGLNKLDLLFMLTVGRTMADQLTWGWSETLEHLPRSAIVLALPTIELMAGLGLCFRRWRPRLVWAVYAIHLGLLTVLGPWGLDHSWGVLLWNGVCLVNAWFLFRDHAPEPTLPSDSVGVPSWRRVLASAYVGLFAVLPLGDRTGNWDHWLSWSVYAPHTSRASLQIRRGVLSPRELSAGPWRDETSVESRTVDFDAFTLRDRWVPAYPQARYQYELAKRLVERGDWGSGVTVEVSSAADRRRGKRHSQRRLFGTDAIIRSDWRSLRSDDKWAR